MLQVRMMSSEAGDTYPGESVAETTFEKITADESCRRRCSDLKGRGVTTFVKHLLRGQRRVALANHPVMMGSIPDAVMQNVTSQLFYARS